MGSVLRDGDSLTTFKTAIFTIVGGDEPTRSQLRNIGRELANIAGRSKPWSGGHLYNVLHCERMSNERLGIHPDLFDAALKRADMIAANAKVRTVVMARGVRAGAIVLARSHKCFRRSCRIVFVPDTPHRKYCSDECAARVEAHRRKERQRRRREKARRRRR